jgi:hypothetical protein
VLGFAGPEWLNGAREILEGWPPQRAVVRRRDRSARRAGARVPSHYQNLAPAVNGRCSSATTAARSSNNTFGAPASIAQIETMYPFYFGAGSGTATPHKDDIAGLDAPSPLGSSRRRGQRQEIIARITSRLTG